MFVVKCGMVHTRCGDTWGVDKKFEILGIWTWKNVDSTMKNGDLIWFGHQIRFNGMLIVYFLTNYI